MASSSSSGFWPQWQENKLFALLLAILLVYGIVYLGVLVRKELLASNMIGIADREPSMIVVSASDSASIIPDIATVDLGVMVSAATADKAQDENAAKTNAVLAAMKALGIEERDLKTSSYSVDASYNYEVSPPRIVGYDARQTITVKIREQAKVSAVLEAATNAGATSVGSLRFEVDDPAAAEADARKKAIAKAYEQATAIAGAMNAKLGDVVSYSESGGDGGLLYALDSAFGRGGATPEVAPGEQEITKNVTIQFSIK